MKMMKSTQPWGGWGRFSSPILRCKKKIRIDDLLLKGLLEKIIKHDQFIKLDEKATRIVDLLERELVLEKFLEKINLKVLIEVLQLLQTLKNLLGFLALANELLGHLEEHRVLQPLKLHTKLFEFLREKPLEHVTLKETFGDEHQELFLQQQFLLFVLFHHFLHCSLKAGKHFDFLVSVCLRCMRNDVVIIN